VNFENKLKSIGFKPHPPTITIDRGNGVTLQIVTKHNIESLKNQFVSHSYKSIFIDDKIQLKTYKYRFNKEKTFLINFDRHGSNYFIIFDEILNRIEFVKSFDITPNFWNELLSQSPVYIQREWKIKQIFKTK
jgi:hypothetical protein